MSDQNIIEECMYFISAESETEQNNIGRNCMQITFDLLIDPEEYAEGTGSPDPRDPFSEQEVSVLRCDADKAEITVTDVYWFKDGDEVNRKFNQQDIQAAQAMLNAMRLLDSVFVAYLQRVIDYRCDEIMKGEWL